jgi:hypothetical protein
MESVTIFDRKISITPTELNELKNTKIDTILLRKLQLTIENKCSEHGFILQGSAKVLSRSMGYFESCRFTGETVYYVKVQCSVIYPVDGVRLQCNVTRKNKMGLYVNYNRAINIQVPRDLHIGNIEFDNVQIGDNVEVELKRSKFSINDPYILGSGIFIKNNRQENKDNSKQMNKINPIEELELDSDDESQEQQQQQQQQEQQEQQEQQQQEQQEQQEQEQEQEQEQQQEQEQEQELEDDKS